jgi:glutaredoxin
MAFSFPWLWRKRARQRVPVQIVMYTRQGCHLCDAAWKTLEQARERYRFDLSSVDVDRDPALAALYGEQVPVVTVDGHVRFRGGVNAALLERLLRAEAGGSA